MKQQGQFISFEGIDGAGKSYFSKVLAHVLSQNGIECQAVSGAIYTDFSKQLVKLILENEGKKSSKQFSKFKAMLFASLNIQTYQACIKPLLDKGVWVVADRFFDSILAYHGYASKDSFLIEDFSHLRQFAFKDKAPNLTFVLKLPVALAQQRRQNRAQMNAYDQKSFSYFQRMQNGYLSIAKQEPERVKVISNKNSQIDTKKKIIKQLILKYPHLSFIQNQR